MAVDSAPESVCHFKGTIPVHHHLCATHSFVPENVQNLSNSQSYLNVVIQREGRGGKLISMTKEFFELGVSRFVIPQHCKYAYIHALW